MAPRGVLRGLMPIYGQHQLVLYSYGLIGGEWRYPRMTTLPSNLVFYQVYVLVQVINSRMMASDSCCALDARAQHYPSSIGWGHFHLPTAFSLCILPLSRGVGQLC